MRNFIPPLLLALCSLLLLLLGCVQSRGIPTNMGMDHVGFTVRNVTEAADFLMQVFDCVFDWEVIREPTPTAGERGWSTLFDVHPDSYMPHVMMLKCGDYHLTQYIELFQWSSPDQVVPEQGRKWMKFSDLGHGYLSFTVKDVFAVVEHIKALNWPGVRVIQDPPMQFPLRGETCTSTFVVSPWGQWIELTQWSISGPQGSVIRALTDTCSSTDASTCTSNSHAAKRHPEVGMSVTDLETPALIVDLNVMERNVKLLQSRLGGVDWRPPVKAHKSPALARHLVSLGAKGVVVLKLSEAEIFGDNGIDDIYIANVIVDPKKIQRLVSLKRRISRLRIHVDNVKNLKDIASAAKFANVEIEVLVEINIGHNRTGVLPHQAVNLAQAVVDSGPHVKFVGVTGYEGHTPVLEPEAKTKETIRCHNKLAEAKTLVESAGIAVNVVSAGGSCNYVDALNAKVINELQAGGVAIVDSLYAYKAHLSNHGHEIGAFVLTQVVSVPEERDRAMADAGFKTMGWHPFGGLPLIHNRNDIEAAGLSAEHLKLKGVNGSAVNLEVGEKLLVVPGYMDAMGMLHRRIYAVRDGKVEDVWPVLAAGAIH